MPSRDRVLQTLNLQQPDRVPVDLGGHRAGGIMGMAYVRLREYLDLPKTLPRIYDMPQQLAIVEEDVLERFQVDVIELGRAYCLDDSCWQPWVLPDGLECLIPRWINPIRRNGDWVVYHRDGTPIAIQKQSMIYFDQACFPFRDKPEATLDRLEEMLEYEMWSALPLPPGPTIPYDQAGLHALADGARRLRENTSRAIVGLFRCPLLEGGQHLFGMDIFAPGGGYVFQQVHNIEADVPPENIVAMFDAVSEWNAAHS